jgi:hypothetical protein
MQMQTSEDMASGNEQRLTDQTGREKPARTVKNIKREHPTG